MGDIKMAEMIIIFGLWAWFFLGVLAIWWLVNVIYYKVTYKLTWKKAMTVTMREL